MKKVFIFILLCPLVFSQSNKPVTASDIENLPEVMIGLPVIHGNLNDGFPDSAKVNGKIIKVSLTVPCGILCNGGTAEILLDDNSLFPAKTIIIIIPCFSEFKEEYKNKSMTYVIYKYLGSEPECFYTNVTNNLFTDGTPFYYVKKNPFR